MCRQGRAVAFRCIPLPEEVAADRAGRTEDLVVRIVVIKRLTEESPNDWPINTRCYCRTGVYVRRRSNVVSVRRLWT